MSIEETMARLQAGREAEVARTAADYLARCCPACDEEMASGAYLDCEECGYEVEEGDVTLLHASHADLIDGPAEECTFAICAAWYEVNG